LKNLQLSIFHTKNQFQLPKAKICRSGTGLATFFRFKSGVHYIRGSLLLLRVESHAFSQVEKERTACKAEQVHKMTTIFDENGPRLSF
jgi:hypothetical protein